MWNYINHRKNIIDQAPLGKIRNCPICNSDNSKTVLELKDFQFYSDSDEYPKQFSLKENMCLICSCIFLNPVYSDYGFNVLFREAGQSYGVSDDHITNQINWLNERGMLENRHSLLDVGCYEGGFLSKLPEKVNKYGVDIDEQAIIKAKKLYPEIASNFFHGSFENFDHKGEEPDTIVMFHVLEHVANPVKVLEKLKKISKEDTNLVIEVPVLEKGKTNDINGFLSIQHATHFSKNSLRNCLKKSGWKIIEEELMTDYNGFRISAKPYSKILNNTDFKIQQSDEDTYLFFDYLSNWYLSLRDVEKKITNIKNLPFYVIWGGGAHTEFIYQLTSFFHNKSKSKYLIVDSDNLKHGTSWRGIKIENTNILKKIDWNETGLLISSYGSQDQIKELAIKKGIKEEHIYYLYENITSY